MGDLGNGWACEMSGLDWIRQYVCRTEPERGGLLQQRG
jgi:hypothetical protein